MHSVVELRPEGTVIDRFKQIGWNYQLDGTDRTKLIGLNHREDSDQIESPIGFALNHR